jgi:hypothetical protein
MTDLGQVIDHAAELQREIDRLSSEVMTLALAGVALALVCALMGWRLWRG